MTKTEIEQKFIQLAAEMGKIQFNIELMKGEQAQLAQKMLELNNEHMKLTQPAAQDAVNEEIHG